MHKKIDFGLYDKRKFSKEKTNTHTYMKWNYKNSFEKHFLNDIVLNEAIKNTAKLASSKNSPIKDYIPKSKILDHNLPIWSDNNTNIQKIKVKGHVTGYNYYMDTKLNKNEFLSIKEENDTMYIQRIKDTKSFVEIKRVFKEEMKYFKIKEQLNNEFFTKDLKVKPAEIKILNENKDVTLFGDPTLIGQIDYEKKINVYHTKTEKKQEIHYRDDWDCVSQDESAVDIFLRSEHMDNLKIHELSIVEKMIISDILCLHNIENEKVYWTNKLYNPMAKKAKIMLNSDTTDYLLQDNQNLNDLVKVYSEAEKFIINDILGKENYEHTINLLYGCVRSNFEKTVIKIEEVHGFSDKEYVEKLKKWYKSKDSILFFRETILENNRLIEQKLIKSAINQQILENSNSELGDIVISEIEIDV